MRRGLKSKVTLKKLTGMVAGGFAFVDTKFEGMDARLGNIDRRLNGIEQKMAIKRRKRHSKSSTKSRDVRTS